MTTTQTSSAPAGASGARRLVPEHEQYFRARAITPDRALAHGFHSVDGVEAAWLLGRRGPLPSGGIAMPYPSTEADGRQYARIRCDDPDLCGGRYLSPEDVEVPLYAPHAMSLANDPIVIVESPVKAVALAEAGFAAVGLGGVNTTLSGEDGPPRLNASWLYVFGGEQGIANRRFVILFDTSRNTNAQVAAAEAKLANALAGSRARVEIARLNLVATDADAGPDDVLAKYGRVAIETALANVVPANAIAWVRSADSPADLLSDLGFKMAVLATPGAATEVPMEFAQRKWPRMELARCLRAAKRALAATTSGHSEPIYTMVNNRLVEARGEDNRVLAGFAPRIVEEVHRDDGLTRSISFTVEATAADGSALGRASLTPAQLERPAWAAASFGNAAVLHAHPREVQAAMQSVSTPRRTECRTHIGWFEAGDGIAYAHAGGVIGDAEAAVEVPAELGGYVLPNHSPNIARAFDLLMRISSVAVRSVAVMLIAAVPDALLQHWKPSPFVMALLGKTGSRKTSLAHLVLSAFADVPYGRLTTGFESTAAAIENVMFIGKDTLVGIDDFVPGTSDPRAETVKKAEEIIRRVANRTSRSRMTSTMAAQLARPPRAAVIVTGEERPGHTQSIAARLLSARLAPDAVKLGRLSELQAERDQLRNLTAALVAHLAPRTPYLAEMLRTRVEGARARFEGIGGHARVAESLAHLRAAFEVLMEFARAHDLLSPDECVDWLAWADVALRALGEAQAASSREADPVDRFLDMLAELEASGRIWLPRIEENRTVREDAGPGARHVGWRVGTTLLLLPNETFNAINESLRRGSQGDLGCKPSELWERLAERGLLANTGTKDRPFEAQRVIDGQKRRVRILKFRTDGPPTDFGGPAHESDGSEAPRAGTETSASGEREVTVASAGDVYVLRAHGAFVAALHGDGAVDGGVSSTDTLVGHDLREPVRRLLAARVEPGPLWDSRIAALVVEGGTGASTQGYYDLDSIAQRHGRVADVGFAACLHRLATRTDSDRAIVALEHRALVAAAAMQNAGLPIDREAWSALVDRRRMLVEDAELFLVDQLGGDIRNDEQLLSALHAKGFDVDGTGVDHLHHVRGHEVIETLVLWRRAAAFLNGLGPAVLQASERDGRVHAQINAWGTETGRFTTSNPNVLGLEKAVEVRRCIVAPAGRVLITIDVNAADLRSLAAITEDPALIAMFVAGACPHTTTAASLFGCPSGDVTPTQREVAKVVNFTTVFGGGCDAAVSQAQARRLPLTPEDAANFMARFRERYARVAAWQDEIGRSAADRVFSLLGRSRWFAARDVCARLNAPVQMTTADGAKLAAAALHDELKPFGARQLLVVHDEYVIEAQAENAREVATHATNVITREFGRALLGRVPVAATVKTLGRSWGGDDDTGR